ncbi:MAG: DHH family phosphoesterase [Sulfolobales archaeon]
MSEIYSRRVLVSHEEDIDGLASAALLLRVYRDSDVILTNYHRGKWMYAIRKIRALCSVSKNLQIFITDLNLKTWMIEELDKALKRCYEKKVIWIDHHVWDEESIEIIKKLSYVEVYGDREHTATELVASFIGLKDEVTELLTELSRDSDYGLFRNPLTEPLTDLIRYLVYVARRKSRLVKLVKRFSRGVVWDSYADFTWGIAVEYKRRVLEEARKSLIETSINNCRVLFIFANPMLSSGVILNTLDRQYDIAFTIYTNGSITIARSRDQRIIDCSLIARRLGGGGHRHIAGAQVNPRLARDREEIIKHIVSIARDFIPRCR